MRSAFAAVALLASSLLPGMCLAQDSQVTPVFSPSSGRSWAAVKTYNGTGAADAAVCSIDISYYDGLGYEVQTSQVGASTGGHDISSSVMYDALRRPVRSWLPYAFVNSGQFDFDADVFRHEWYSDRYGVEDADRAFSEKALESAPSGRLLSETLPGYDMDGTGMTCEYVTNNLSDDLRIMLVDLASGTLTVGGHYDEGMLTGVRTTDADGRVSLAWTDREGRMVRSDSFLSSSERACTLYAYDALGRLRWVVQPQGAAQLPSTPVAPDSEFAERWCFVYGYDALGRVVSKRIPGKGEEIFAYDEMDRLVTSQDESMRDRGERVFYEYDALGRTTRKKIEKRFHPMQPAFRETVLEETCYDVTPSDRYPAVDDVIGDVDLLENPAGLRTWQKVAVLDSASPFDSSSTQYAQRWYWYDSRERLVQSREERPDGSTRVMSLAYDLAGNVLRMRETVSLGGEVENGNHSLLTEYTYDGRGRVISCARTLDGTALDTVNYEYDELGRPCSRGVEGKVTETTSYDMRGWRSAIATTRNGETIFSEVLRYASPERPGSVAQYSGNISEITTSQHRLQPDTYSYLYDGMSRLTDAKHFIGSSQTMTISDTEKDICYDLNGNITSMHRNWAGMDCDWTFTRDGNRLESAEVSEMGSSQVYSYSHDLNGNRTSGDLDGFEISYNIINLPFEVRFPGAVSGGVMPEGVPDDGGEVPDSLATGGMEVVARYMYLSDGTKMSAVSDGWYGLVYLGSFVYGIDGETGDVHLDGVSWDEGRIGWDWSVERPRDMWFVKDHLGNVRSIVDLSVDSSSSPVSVIMDQTDYLPYGLATSASYGGESGNRWRFSGKEEQNVGLFASRLIDFGARWYDPFSCTWLGVDPMGEVIPSMTPYNYCVGSPVRFIDPNGLWQVTGDGYFLQEDGDDEVSFAKFMNCSVEMASKMLDKSGYIMTDGSFCLSASVVSGDEPSSDETGRKVFELVNASMSMTGLGLQSSSNPLSKMTYRLTNSKGQIDPRLYRTGWNQGNQYISKSMIHTVKGLGKQISRYSMYANYLDAALCYKDFLASDDPAQRAVLLMDMSMDILVCILPELTPVGVMWVMIGEDAVSKMIVNNRY